MEGSKVSLLAEINTLKEKNKFLEETLSRALKRGK